MILGPASSHPHPHRFVILTVRPLSSTSSMWSIRRAMSQSPRPRRYTGVPERLDI